MKIGVKLFDLSRIKPNCIIFNSPGKRGTGKSKIMLDLLYNLKDLWDIVIAMAPTTSSINEFKKHIPDAFIFEDGYKMSQLKSMTTIFKEHLKTRDVGDSKVQKNVEPLFLTIV